MTRAEAIKILSFRDNRGLPITWQDGFVDAVDTAIEALKEQKTGKWIIFPPCFEEICMCSNCRTKFKKAYQGSDTCPNCGARME